MKTIKELLDIVITLEDNPQTSKVIDFHKGVPTLESGVYRKASMGNWEDHATGLFALNRVSIFAASDNSYEMICLIWFDGTEEPELWVYDCNGESRYKDLASYLQAYIDDDVSASAVKWKLADM